MSEFAADDLDSVVSFEKPKPANFRKEINVGGFKYIATHPDPETAFRMGTELSRLIGEPVAAMVDGAGGGDRVSQALQNAAKIFLQKIDPGLMLAILKKTLSYVELQKNENNNTKTLLNDAAIKIHFQGRHGDMFQVFVEAMVFQQADFFLAMKRTLTQMMTKVKA